MVERFLFLDSSIPKNFSGIWYLIIFSYGDQRFRISFDETQESLYLFWNLPQMGSWGLLKELFEVFEVCTYIHRSQWNSRSRFHSRGCCRVWSESFIWIQITFSFIWTYWRLIFCPTGFCFRFYDHAYWTIWCNISDIQVAKTLLSKYNESRTGILGFFGEGVGGWWFYVPIENFFTHMETLTGVFRFHISFLTTYMNII